MTDASTTVWCKPGEWRSIHAVHTIKAYAQLCGVIGWSFKAFRRYNGYMNLVTYHSFLCKHVGSFTSKLRRHKFYQDNIPYHKTETILTWLEDNGIEHLDVPPHILPNLTQENTYDPSKMLRSSSTTRSGL